MWLNSMALMAGTNHPLELGTSTQAWMRWPAGLTTILASFMP